MRITQPFGVNYVQKGFYSNVGLKGDKHNGIDLSSPTGNEVYAVDDGFCQADVNDADKGYGINVRLFIKVDGVLKFECVYGHLLDIVKTGEVKARELIAHSDNTGYSTGPHVHFGVRELIPNQQGWSVKDYDNGYYGYFDPMPLFAKDTGKLPVELKYGRQETFAEEIAGRVKFAPDYLWYLRTFKKAPSQIEYNALRYGYYSARDVNDPAMFPIWSEMTRPEAVKRGLVKK